MPGMQDIMKLANMKNKFEKNHPKFIAFIKSIAQSGISEGDIIEVTLKKSDGTVTTSNIRITADDVGIINDLRNMR